MGGHRFCRWPPLLLGVVAIWVGLAADAVAQGSAATDRAALEAIYLATGGDNWTVNTNWLSAAPLEDWYGVETNEQGRVTGLRLGGWDETAREHVGNGLVGSLPPELGTLSRLRSLEVGGNSGLTGPIPAALGNLTELEWLTLQENWLTGSIPAVLGHLSNLQGLALDRNALTGSIPADLGNLQYLRGLTFGGNTLSGPVPPELGNLIGLEDLYLGNTMLAGPLPASMSGLSALESLSLDGSGLCVPDSPAMRAWVAAIADFTGAVCEGPASFSRMVTPLFDLDRVDFVSAVVDLNGDGRNDILGGEHLELNVATPEERLIKVPLHVFVGEGDGSFRPAPELVEGPIDVRSPIVVADDFNGDGRADLAVFDYGAYVFAVRSGYGNPPQLFLSGPDGRLRPSNALADAVRRAHERNPQGPGKGISGPADLHLKSATSGDIDGDGDVDLWVDSIGGANVSSHFMVNNGDGTFTVDEDRAPRTLRYNPPENWYHVQGHLVDLDHDGDLDLALGQSRHFALAVVNQFSIVLVNDGTGHYPTRIELPHPAFNEGYTLVRGQTHFDVDRDGFQDLLTVHTRNSDAQPNVLPFTGRYVQVLVNRGGASFADETRARMGEQRATTPERNPDGDPLHNDAEPRMHDVDRDGCADLVMSQVDGYVRIESPFVYRNDGSGRFEAMSPVAFVGSDRYFGLGAVPGDVNGDEAIDFVVPYRNNGPDHEYGTADDFAMLVTLVNTTPAGLARCGGRANRAPVPSGTLPNRTLAQDITQDVDVSQAFVDPDGDALIYTVSSSALGVVAARAAGARVTLTAVGEGTATIRVTATDPGGLSAEQQFTVTVSPPANRPPAPVGVLAALTLGVDDAAVALELSGAFRDPDGDALSYGAASSSPSVAAVAVSGSTVTVTPLSEGMSTVTVTATDAGGSNGTATQPFAVTVGPAANRRPEVVGVLAALTLGVDDAAVAVELSGAFRDPDGDALSYGAASSSPSVAAVAVSGSTVTVTPLSEGMSTVTVTATDAGGSNGTATQPFAVTVGPAANRPPEAVGVLPPVTLGVDDSAVTVDVASAFRDPDGDVLTYRASSSAPHVVTAQAAGARVTLAAVGEGTATVEVTATDSDGLSATQSFRVRVTAPFTDDPIQPGVTPVRAVHFTELRARIDALREEAELGRFRWTDPVLRPGVTPVRRVHVLELRQALAEAYSASGPGGSALDGRVAVGGVDPDPSAARDGASRCGAGAGVRSSSISVSASADFTSPESRREAIP